MTSLSLVNLLFYTVVCVGMSFILKYGTILAVIRNFLTKRSEYLKELFSCSLCLGFWCGIITGIVVDPYYTLIWGFYGAAVCWTGDFLMDILVKWSR